MREEDDSVSVRETLRFLFEQAKCCEKIGLFACFKTRLSHRGCRRTICQNAAKRLASSLFLSASCMPVCTYSCQNCEKIDFFSQANASWKPIQATFSFFSLAVLKYRMLQQHPTHGLHASGHRITGQKKKIFKTRYWPTAYRPWVNIHIYSTSIFPSNVPVLTYGK